MAEVGLEVPPAEARIRLHFLDGLRALAALYVLIFHTFNIVVPQQGTLSPPLAFLKEVFGYGHMAVAIFIVLSGFSLMLPLARTGEDHLAGGMGPYVKRRARRLLPPYYGALALSIASIVVYQAISSGPSGVPERAVDRATQPDVALSAGSVLSHVFLVHNLSFDWAYRINGPMWSVATEWQIYFLMPLVLLPLWRRFGGTVTVFAAWFLACLLYFAVPMSQNLYWAAPWFVGSFALGMWGAMAAFSESDRAARFRHLPWGWITLGLFAALVAIIATDNADWPYPFVDGLVSLLALSLILCCCRRALRPQQPSTLVRVLGTPTMAYVAGFSYSIYLVQHPLLRLIEEGLGRLDGLSYQQVIILALVVGDTLVIAAAWLFAEFFERPFTGGGVILPLMKRGFRRRTPSTGAGDGATLAPSFPPPQELPG